MQKMLELMEATEVNGGFSEGVSYGDFWNKILLVTKPGGL